MRLSRRLSLAIPALAAALFAATAALPRLRASLPAPPSIEVKAKRVELAPDDPARSRLGSLLFLGGLELDSDDPRFGGLSDLRLDADRRHMVAVSDCGYGFSAELTYDASGTLSGLASPRLVDLTGPGGRRLMVDENDAESLVADGRYLDVGFEGRGRVWRYSAAPPFGPPVGVLDTPPDLRRCGSNTGIETMVLVDAERRLLVCEGERTPSLSVPAWIGGDGDWVERRYPLSFEGSWTGRPFRPTGATRLDDGDLLVLERRFPPFGSRVVRVPRTGLDGVGPLPTVEVANLEGSSLVDNYEGIEARRDAAGRKLVYLLSDDNSCAKPGGTRFVLAHTRLLLFELLG